MGYELRRHPRRTEVRGQIGQVLEAQAEGKEYGKVRHDLQLPGVVARNKGSEEGFVGVGGRIRPYLAIMVQGQKEVERGRV